EKALGGRPPEAAPGLAPVVGEGQEDEALLQLHPRERLGDRLQAARARGRERDDLMLARRRLDEAGERAADVRVDSGARMRQRADVERDSQAARGATYVKRVKWIPSTRVSGF